MRESLTEFRRYTLKSGTAFVAAILITATNATILAGAVMRMATTSDISEGRENCHKSGRWGAV
jgi:hypothetical protein